VVSPRSFERDLADLTPDEFEQLVHRIVRKSHPGAKKVKAPDFGADVLADPERSDPWVLQVKHYPGPINWKKCEKSLDRAASKWKPRRIAFVFPQDLTAPQLQAFESRLRKRKPGIEVDPWTASDLNAALDEYPDIRRSCFEHRQDLLHDVLRAAQLKERPRDADTLLEHGLDLAELVNEIDPHFTYELRSRAADVPESVWLRPPFMKALVAGPEGESTVAAWPRPEADDPQVTWTFTKDDAGERAREQLYRAFAAGSSAELREGLAVTATRAPRAMTSLMERGGDEGEWTLTATPADETVSLDIELEAPGALQKLFTFEMRPAPPQPEHQGAWIGRAAGVLLYVGYSLSEDGVLTMQVRPILDLTSSAGENMMAVQTVLDLMSGPLVLRGEIMPEDARIDLRSELDDEDIPRLEFLRDACSAFIEIEVHSGRLFHLPDVIGGDEAVNAIELAHMLRTRVASGEGQMTSHIEAPPGVAGEIAMRLTESRQFVIPMERELLGERVSAGWSRVTFEKVEVSVTPGGALKPTSDVRVTASGSVDVQVIDAPLPFDIVIQPGRSGNWATASASFQPQ
jgi:hypothetical protein